MRCPRSRAHDDMRLTDGRYDCPDCGWIVRLHDAAFAIPTDEAGWTQGHGEPLVLVEASVRELSQQARRGTIADRLCIDCDEPYAPNAGMQKRCTACAVKDRRKDVTGARMSANRLTAPLRRSA